MITFTLDKPDNIHNIFKKYRKSGAYKFRGHSDSNWKLVPKAGRENFNKIQDRKIFRQWLRRGKSYLQNHSLSDWDYLVTAQHTGLPTRLLDWSHIPLIAAFFAANENFDKDGAIFIAQPPSYLDEQKEEPFSTEMHKIRFYQPSSPLSRASNQFSYFTVHNPPNLEISGGNIDLKGEIEKIIIPKNLKPELVFLLNQYGVNFLSIYPDLEGLSRHLSWFAENQEYWNNTVEE